MNPRRVSLGEPRTSTDGCRRYRPVQLTFDTRNVMLDQEIGADWEPRVQRQWEANQAAIRMGLLAEHGTVDGEAKIENYRAMGAAPWSVVFEHNALLAQIRSSFTHGDFYPALVGACALGERIYTELISVLRDDYVNHPATTRRIRRGDRPEWNSAIEVLRGWGLLPEAVDEAYAELKMRRDASVHCDPVVRAGEREPALEALHLAQEIVAGMFAPIGGPPRFIAGVAGGSFLSLEAEQDPIVKRVFLPRSALLSPAHRMLPSETPVSIEWTIIDDPDYAPATLTDDEFAAALPAGIASMQPNV